MFVHLLDSTGAVVAQHDGVPANASIPTTDWAAGEIVADQHLISFPDLPPGEYRVVVGMYNAATGERLSVSEGGATVLLQTIKIETKHDQATSQTDDESVE